MSHGNLHNFPYPVLSPQRSDYHARCHFAVQIPHAALSRGGIINIALKFSLSSEFLLSLIEERKAAYMAMVECARTYQRQSFPFRSADEVLELDHGEWPDSLQLTPYVTSTQPLPAFHSAEHSSLIQALAPQGINLPVGAFLAIGHSVSIEPEEEEAVVSIFDLVPNRHLTQGSFRTDLTGERIAIHLHPADHKALAEMRQRSGTEPLLHQGLYLHALHKALRHIQDYGDRQWSRVLRQRLAAATAQDEHEDWAGNAETLAQQLLERPLARMLDTLRPDSGDEGNLPVFRLTDAAFRALVKTAEQRPALWQDPTTDFGQVLSELGLENHLEKTELTTRSPIHLDPPAGGQPRAADRQALDFHRNFVGMTPALASDPNLLAWINHFALHGYGIQRWPLRANSKPDRHIKDHWLAESANRIYEASISGRTLWLAEICLRAEKASEGAFTAAQALELFSEGAERYHNCMRFSFMRSPTVTAEYIRLLLNEAQGISVESIQALVRRLNLEAGALLVDALDRRQLRELIVRTAKWVMADQQA